MAKKVWLQEMTWSEVEAKIANCDVAIIPIGSVEQHGWHLPEGTDTMVAIKLAEDVAQRTSAVIVPPVWYGWSPHHMALPGSISIRPEVLIQLVSDICRSLAHHGFKKIIFINGHRIVNIPWLQLVAGTVQEETGLQILIVDPAYIGKKVEDHLGFGVIGHADEIETSHMLFIHPELVNMDKAQGHTAPQKKLYHIDPRTHEDTLVYIPSRANDLKKLKDVSGGCVGEPQKATIKAGNELHRYIVNNIVNIVEELRK
jgi:creatinine amidohydrolase